MVSVHQYYKWLELKDNFNLTLITEKKVLEILQCVDVSKATRIDKAPGKLLKYNPNIAEICNTSNCTKKEVFH